MEKKKHYEPRKREVPIWERTLLTVNEASDYTGIGQKRLRDLAATPRTNLVVWIGSRMMFKRKKLEEYLDDAVTL